MGKNLRGTTSGASIPKSLRFIPRQVETDADTRKAGRREIEEMLPASTAIINVYQLVQKKVKGGAADRRVLGKQKTKRSSGGQPQKAYPSYISGREIDKYGNIIRDSERFPAEDDREYDRVNKLQHQMAEAAKQKSEEEAIRKTTESIKNIREATETGKKVVAQAKATSPQSKLIERIITERIPYQHTVLNDGRYKGFNVMEEDQIESINKAIDRAKKDDLFAPGIFPKPIIAVGKNMNNPRSTKTVYVLKDLSNLRRKKIVHSKVKRPITHGNKKKRIVMKKKGGKR